MRKILLLSLLSLVSLCLPAQTVIDLKRGGGVRAKTVDDYKEEMKIADRLREDSVTYVDNLRRAFNALHTDSLDEAEHLFNEALRLRPSAPGNHVVRYNLALVDLARGKYNDAVVKLNAILKEHPDYVDARMVRAETFLQQGKAAEAVSDADIVLDHLGNQPSDAIVRNKIIFVRAAARYQQHMYVETRADLLTLLKAEPRNESALVLEALTLLKMGQPKEALNRLNLIVSMYPKSTDALVTRAQVQAELGMNVPARADYDALIAMNPQVSDYYIERARILIRMGEKYAARRDLDKAVDLGVSHGVVQALYKLTRN